MPFSFSVFGNILSELRTFFIGRIPQTTLAPLAVVVVGLMTVTGLSVGWQALAERWSDVGSFAQAVYLAGAGFGFLFLVSALTSLQGAVSRGFQGHYWSGWLAWRTGHMRWHRVVWEQRRRSWKQSQDLYDAVVTAQERVTECGKTVAPAEWVFEASQALPRYHVLARDDLRRASVAKAPTGALTRFDDAATQVTLQPLAKGAQLTSQQLMPIPDASWICGMSIVPVALSIETIPCELKPGDVVDVNDRRDNSGFPINPGGLFVLCVERLSRQKSDGKLVDLVGLSLAAPPEIAHRLLSLSAADRLAVSLQFGPVRPTAPCLKVDRCGKLGA